MGNTNKKQDKEFAQTFEELAQRVEEVNLLTVSYTDSQGRKLKFDLFPRKQDDIIIPFLWKVLVHIRASKIPSDQSPHKMLSFQQFCMVYTKLKEYENLAPYEDESSPTLSPSPGVHKVNEKECTICMDRDSSLVLPCFHSFCEQCINMWRTKSETCPICRVQMEGPTEECFVLANPPTNAEVKSFFSEFFDHLDGLDIGD